MKKKSENSEYNKFKNMAFVLLANKFFNDYITARQQFNVEPEFFYEEWLKRSVLEPDEELKIWTWRYFLSNLIEYRKIQKL